MLIITDKQIVGKREKVDFPQLDIFSVDAKVDTGAFTSSIHCHNIKLISRQKKKYVRFNLLDPSHPAYNEKEFTLPLHASRTIRNSFGDSEKRYIILTSICVFDQVFDIELSLADRSKMEYPVLLGRKFLKGRFLVDIDQVNLSEKYRKKKQKAAAKELRKKKSGKQ